MLGPMAARKKASRKKTARKKPSVAVVALNAELLAIGGRLKLDKHELFAQLYSCDEMVWGNASACYRKAYPGAKGPGESAHALLKNPHITDRVRELTVWKASQVDVDADWMHTRLGWMSGYNVADVVERISKFVTKDEDGEPTAPHWEFDLATIPRELSYCIEECSFDSSGRPKIKMIAKLKAIELLGKLTKVKAFAEDEALGDDREIAALIIRGRTRRGMED